MNWLSFFIGAFVAWVIEWLVDVNYWRRRNCNDVAAAEARCAAAHRDELGNAERLLQESRSTVQSQAAEIVALRSLLAGQDEATRRSDAVPLTSGLPDVPAVLPAVAVPPVPLPIPIPAVGGLIPGEPPAASRPDTQSQDEQPEEKQEDKRTPDDLEIVEGIGPKIAALLRENGISTFVALGAADANVLRAILHAAGPHYRVANPSTWPEQARLAAAGAWDELAALKARLTAGVDKDL